jgi:hypothetical protein
MYAIRRREVACARWLKTRHNLVHRVDMAPVAQQVRGRRPTTPNELRELRKENVQLKKLQAEAELDKAML